MEKGEKSSATVAWISKKVGKKATLLSTSTPPPSTQSQKKEKNTWPGKKQIQLVQRFIPQEREREKYTLGKKKDNSLSIVYVEE